MDGSSNEGQLIYKLYYIVNNCLQVFKFKSEVIRCVQHFLMKIDITSYRTIIKKKKKLGHDLQLSYTKQMVDKT